MINTKFGKLTVIEELKDRTPDRHIRYKCACDCGSEVITTGRRLRAKKIPSCGCAFKGENNPKRIDNPCKRHPLYKIYTGIKTRCFNKNSIPYANYGGRGITMCDRWVESFWNFVEDMPPRPEGYSIDRIDNEKGYFKENCKWSTAKEQANNRRKNRGWKRCREIRM